MMKRRLPAEWPSCSPGRTLGSRGCTGARKALQYIAENPVDVVLTDIEMPDMNGLELSQRLMEYPNIQKIFFSSYSITNTSARRCKTVWRIT